MVCKLGEIIEQATPEERVALITAITELDVHDNYVWSARQLSRAIRQTRFTVGATTIKDHRNKTCGCLNDN